MRFRKLAGVAAGALVGGVLVAPVLGAAPAQAEEGGLTVSQSYNCTYSSYSTTFAATYGIDIDGDQLTMTVNNLPAFAGVPATFEFTRMDASLPLVVNGEAVTAVSERLVYDPVLMGNAPSLPIGAMKATLPAGVDDVRDIVVDDLALTMGVIAKPYAQMPLDGKIACASVGDAVVAKVPLSGVNGACEIDMSESGFGDKASFPARITTTAAVPDTGTVGIGTEVPVQTAITMGGEFSDYIETSPTKKLSGSVVPQVRIGDAVATGAIALSEWTRDLVAGPPNAAIGQKVHEFVTLRGEGNATVVPAAAGTHTATLSGHLGTAAMTVTFGDATMDVPLDCTLTEAAGLGEVNVAPGAPSQACIDANAAVTKAAAAVTKAAADVKKADTAVTKAKATVKKANAKVKKAKGKAAKKKAKAALKKAKAAQKKAAKTAKSAKSAHGKAVAAHNAAKKAADAAC